MRIITYEFPQVSNFSFIIFCLCNDLKIEFYKSYFYLWIWFINLNFVAGNLNPFPQSSPYPLLIFSSFPFSMSFSFIKLLLRCARPLSGYEFTNSLTCVTPTKILLLLNHLKTIILKHFTDMLVCNAS